MKHDEPLCLFSACITISRLLKAYLIFLVESSCFTLAGRCLCLVTHRHSTHHTPGCIKRNQGNGHFRLKYKTQALINNQQQCTIFLLSTTIHKRNISVHWRGVDRTTCCMTWVSWHVSLQSSRSLQAGRDQSMQCDDSTHDVVVVHNRQELHRWRWWLHLLHGFNSHCVCSDCSWIPVR